MLPVARHERLTEDAHLRPGVVDVVLALDVIAGRLQHAGQHVAQHRAPAVADLQRAGGVGRDEFHLQRLPRAQVDRAQESGAASTASTCARFQSGDSRRLMKPGGATSTAAIRAPVRSESAIARATSSGARLTVPASRSATLLA